jgi:hypothetical protein
VDAFPQPPPVAQTVTDSFGDGRFVRDRDPADVVVPLAADRAWAPASWWYSVVDGAQGANWGLPMVYHSDAEVLASERMAELARVVPELGWARRLPFYRVAAVGVVMTPARPEIVGLELAGTRAVAPNLVYRLYRSVPPPAVIRWVGSEKITESSEGALDAMLSPDFDPLVEVVREAGAPTAPTQSIVPRRILPEVDILNEEVHAPSPGFAVAAIPWHPDFIVELDGREVPAERVNFAFTGVRVPEGRHRLRVSFASRAVMWGSVLSVVSVLLWIGTAAWIFRYSRSRID